MYEKSRRAFVLGAAALVVHTTLAKPKHKNGHKPKNDRTPESYRLLGWVASMQTHGFAQDNLPTQTLVDMISAGQHIECSCGFVASMGVLVMQQHGYEARRVGCVTRDPWDGHNDGHILMELREGAGWTLFDLDFNRRLPAGVGIDDACAGDRTWATIADDPLCTTWCEGGTTQKAVAAGDAHLFGTSWIEASEGWKCFHDDERRAFYEGKGFRYADADAWAALLA